VDTTPFSSAQANLGELMDRVCDKHETLIITRKGNQSVVMLSLEDYQSLEETAYLLRSPANASRLLASISQLNSGAGIERKSMRWK
jgi:antitoxin YefM